MGSGWRLLYPARAEVTEVQAFQSRDATANGRLRLRLSGVDCTFWGFTATEAASSHHSTIPTTDATGTTVAAASWTVDNSSWAYWAAAGVTKTETSQVYSGTCWSYSAPTITLSGASTCKATRYALGLVWED